MRAERRGAKRPLAWERPGDEPVPPARHPLRCGDPSKLYSPFDYIGPIVDGITFSMDFAYGTGLRRIAQRYARRAAKDAVRVFERATTPEPAAGSQADDLPDDDASEAGACRSYAPSQRTRLEMARRGVQCEGCQTTDRTTLVVGEGGRLVCKSCGAVGRTFAFNDDYKDLHNSDGGKTARGEAYKDAVPTSAISEQTKKKMKLGFAHESATRKSDVTSTLTGGNARKFKSIMEDVDRLLVCIGPVDSVVARRVRMDADRLFTESVKHSALCFSKNCQRALFNKPAFVIAAKSIVHTVEQLVLCGMDGVSRPSIAALHAKTQSAPDFTHRDNATQHQSCLAIIAALDSGRNDVACVDEPPKPARPLAKADLSLKRQASDVQISATVQLRDAISVVCAQFACPAGVRNSAILSLQDAAFSALLREHRLFSKKTSKYAAAYVLLCGVAAEKGVAGFGGKHNASRLQKLGLDLGDLPALVKRAREALPQSAINGADEFADDDLY